MDDQDDNGSIGFTVLHNSSCQHAAATYINLMNAAILRLATGNKNMTIQTRNHPLPMTMSQRSQRHDLDAFSAAIIVNIAFSFIPASFAVALVKEREVKAKHQQLISGVSIAAYWISTYLWDFISYLFPTSLAVILFFIFDLHQFIGRGCFVPTIIIFLEYGLAVAASTYCITFFFSDHSIAQNVILLVHFFGGLILMVISFLMGLIDGTKRANSLLKSIIYFLFTIGLEFLPHHKLTIRTIYEWWHNTVTLPHDTSTSYSQPLLGSSVDVSTAVANEDADVTAERDRIHSGDAKDAIIYLYNLRKVFPAGRNQSAKVAVHSLTFSVREGECFGFLGTNGAGKTTTLSMLTGEECPTDGTAYIFGNDIRLHPKAVRRHIGYCPQFDALLEFLTVREHLELYARIKGVPEMSLKDVVLEKLMEFNLWKHEDKPSYTLSGGNKRKLSVAIAMIGDPPIVILDEPSSGMDPIAKRFMWDVISRLSTRRGKTAVILTTHSMNEAQALCTRIGIMVGGQLRCIGSPQHLKTRFGNHLELEVKPTEISSIELEDLCRRIQETLFDSPSHTRSILIDLESCISGSSTISANNLSKFSLTREMIILVARFLGNEDSIQTLVSSKPVTDGAFGEQLSEQLIRDGGIPLRIFSEWWMAKEKFLLIDSFIISSFPGAKFHGCNGLSVKYQLPYGEDSSLADIFGHLEHNMYQISRYSSFLRMLPCSILPNYVFCNTCPIREKLGIEEYSISQSTLETIFNHFAAIQ